MLVKNWMKHPVITVEPSATIELAKKLMDENRIRSLPVVTAGKLVGIVTDRDIKRTSVADSIGMELPKRIFLNTRIKISAIMTKTVITVAPDTTMDEVGKLLLDKQISGTPVVDDMGGLVGMVTYSEIARLLISMAGIEKKGIQIAVQITTEGGTVRIIADVVRSFGGEISSLLTSYERVPDGYRNAYLKVVNLQPERMEELIAHLKAKAKVLYVIEHTGNGKSPKTWLMST